MNSYLIKLPCFGESDGKLGTFEPDFIPDFQVNRIIYVFDVPAGESRANHACMNASLVFVALAGSIKLTIETEGESEEYVLNDKSIAVYAPPASWVKAFDFSSEAVLVGLSDKAYKDCRYINDYNLYREEIRGINK